MRAPMTRNGRARRTPSFTIRMVPVWSAMKRRRDPSPAWVREIGDVRPRAVSMSSTRRSPGPMARAPGAAGTAQAARTARTIAERREAPERGTRAAWCMDGPRMSDPSRPGGRARSSSLTGDPGPRHAGPLIPPRRSLPRRRPGLSPPPAPPARARPRELAPRVGEIAHLLQAARPAGRFRRGGLGPGAHPPRRRERGRRNRRGRPAPARGPRPERWSRVPAARPPADGIRSGNEICYHLSSEKSSKSSWSSSSPPPSSPLDPGGPLRSIGSIRWTE